MPGVTSPQRRLRACRRWRLIGAGRQRWTGRRRRCCCCCAGRQWLTQDGQSPGTPAERRPLRARSCDGAILLSGSIAAAALTRWPSPAARPTTGRRTVPSRPAASRPARPPATGTRSQRRYICICRDDRTNGRTESAAAPPVRWTCFVARQRSYARDRNINCADNETAAVGDDALRTTIYRARVVQSTHAIDAVLRIVVSDSLQRDSSDSLILNTSILSPITPTGVAGVGSLVFTTVC